jgi:hypothetical protein
MEVKWKVKVLYGAASLRSHFELCAATRLGFFILQALCQIDVTSRHLQLSPCVRKQAEGSESKYLVLLLGPTTLRHSKPDQAPSQH